MKQKLALLLSVSMAFSMFAGVAFGDAAKSTEEKFDALKKDGVFKGDTDGRAHLERDMTRAEYATVLGRLLGLKEVHGVYTYTDKNYGKGNWAAGYIEAVTAEGLMEGKDAKIKFFDFHGKITVEEAAKTLVKALKLKEVEKAENNASAWAKGFFQAAIDAGLMSKDTNPKLNATRAQLVDWTFAASERQKGPKVDSYKFTDSQNVEFTMSDKEVVKVKLEKAVEANKETEAKFKHKDREYTHKVKYEVTSAQKIVSVTADNLKEIVVTFDGSVDKKTAGNKNNYELKDIKFESATLSSDNRSVTLLLEEIGSVLTNQKEIELHVKNVRNEDLSKTFSEKKKFTPVDAKMPEIEKVDGLGTHAIKVTYSEPIKHGDAVISSNYKLDGSMVSASIQYRYPNVVIITKDVSVGEHKLSASNVADYSGLKSVATSKEFTVAEDAKAPEIVGTKTNDLHELEIEFDETVRSIESVYHNVSGNTGHITYKDNKVKVVFSKAMYNGDNSVHVKGVVDYSGNKVNRDVRVSPTLDSTRPEVVKFELKEVGRLHNHQLVIEFSKKLEKDSAQKKEYYTIRDKEGKVIKDFAGLDSDGHPYAKPSYNDVTDKVTIDLNGKLSNEKEYILEIAGVRDRAALQNTMTPYSQTFTAKQTSKSGIVRAYYKQDGAAETLTIQFKTAMKTDGEGSIRSKEKYLLNGRALTDHEFTLVNSDTIRITAKSGYRLGFKYGETNELQVSQVRDIKGNVLKGEVQNNPYTLFYKGTMAQFEDVIALKGVKLDSRTKITAEFSGKLSYVNQDDFVVVTDSNREYRPNGHELSNDGTMLTLKFTGDNELPPSTLYNARFRIKANPTTADALNVRIKSTENTPGILFNENNVRLSVDESSLRVIGDKGSYTATIRVHGKASLGQDYNTTTATAPFMVKINGEDAKTTRPTGVTVHLDSDNRSYLQVQFSVNNDKKLEDEDVVQLMMNGDANKYSKYLVDAGNNPINGFSAQYKLQKHFTNVAVSRIEVLTDKRVKFSMSDNDYIIETPNLQHGSNFVTFDYKGHSYTSSFNYYKVVKHEVVGNNIVIHMGDNATRTVPYTAELKVVQFDYEGVRYNHTL